jgi:PAS domain-containing protein
MLLRELPVMADVVNASGRILEVSAAQAHTLGYEPAALVGGGVEQIYSPDSARLIARALSSGATRSDHPVWLKLRKADATALHMLSQFDAVDVVGEGRCLRIIKMLAEGLHAKLERLEAANDVLSSIVSTSRDASYCIEFLEPLDLTAPDHEVLRQVFENQCVWRYCNESMAHLYKLPLGGDLNQYDVRDVFARNPDNEVFILKLIRSGWKLDGVLSRDHRYDGVDFFVENDVRGDIRRGQLHRFWGTVRDVNVRRARERELEHQVSTALDILGALPDPVFVFDEYGRIEGANPAVEWKLGWRLDSILGTALDSLLNVGLPSGQLFDVALPPAIASSRAARARCKDGRLLGCRVVLAELGDVPAARRRCAAILRFPFLATSNNDDALLDFADQK